MPHVVPRAARTSGARPAAIFLAALLLLAACTAPAASTGPTVVVSGLVRSGPTCPVERVPPDPSCAPHRVAGAVLEIVTAAGSEVTQVTSGADGRWSAALPPGDYRLVPHAVPGLLGTPQAIAFAVAVGGAAPALDVEYDTGIR